MQSIYLVEMNKCASMDMGSNVNFTEGGYREKCGRK